MSSVVAPQQPNEEKTDASSLPYHVFPDTIDAKTGRRFYAVAQKLHELVPESSRAQWMRTWSEWKLEVARCPPELFDAELLAWEMLNRATYAAFAVLDDANPIKEHARRVLCDEPETER